MRKKGVNSAANVAARISADSSVKTASARRNSAKNSANSAKLNSNANSRIFPQIPLEKQRECAKIGMGVSLALTAGTALFMKNSGAKTIHTLSGVALIGFSLWHYSLYPKPHKH